MSWIVRAAAHRGSWDEQAAERRAGGPTASRVVLGALLLAALWGLPVAAYEGHVHQQLTFIAARHYNRCVEETPLARLTPLQVRYVAQANANQADKPWWQRLFRWNYYDRSRQSPGRVLGLLETRMHATFRQTLERLREARDLGRRFTNLGRVVNHVQDATTPAHVVPVFTTRWWRFSVADRFASFAVDEKALQSALGEACASVRGADGTFEELLVSTAERTLESISEPIRGMPSSWSAFWELDGDNDDFGSYGVAGNNFGRETTFKCGEDDARECVLLAQDPLYAEYAAARHLDAVRATMSALAMEQQRRLAHATVKPIARSAPSALASSGVPPHRTATSPSLSFGPSPGPAR